MSPEQVKGKTVERRVSFLLKGGLIFLERQLLEFKYTCAGYIVASDLSGNAKTGERVV